MLQSKKKGEEFSTTEKRIVENRKQPERRALKEKGNTMNIFGVDRTIRRDSTELDGKLFLSGRVSNVQKQRVWEYVRRRQELEPEPRLPAGLQVLQYFILAGMLGAVTFLDHCMERPAAQVLAEEGYLPVIALASAVVYVLAFSPRNRSVWEAVKPFQFRFLPFLGSDVEEESARQLEIPPDARQMDVIATLYRNKKGRTQTEYSLNLPVRVWRQGETLCLAGLTERYSLSVSTIEEIRRERVSLLLPRWNRQDCTPESCGVKGSDLRGYRIHGLLTVSILSPEREISLIVPEYEEETLRFLLPETIPFSET